MGRGDLLGYNFFFVANVIDTSLVHVYVYSLIFFPIVNVCKNQLASICLIDLCY